MSSTRTVWVYTGSRCHVIPADDSPYSTLYQLICAQQLTVEKTDNLIREWTADDLLFLGAPRDNLSVEQIRSVISLLAVGGSVWWVNDRACTLGKGLFTGSWRTGLVTKKRKLNQGLHLGVLSALDKSIVPIESAYTLRVPTDINHVEGVPPWDPSHTPTYFWQRWALGEPGELVIADVPIGLGRLVYVGHPTLLCPTMSSAHYETIWRHGAIQALVYLTSRFCSGLSRQLPRRMKASQRHRLLHGYPMSPVMRPLTHESLVPYIVDRAEVGRSSVLGILPHPFCNPRVKGCGFCTFPHEEFQRSKASQVVSSVIEELELKAETLLADTSAIYLGGGTANLTPLEDLSRLFDVLSSKVISEPIEVTLEGVPKYFLIKESACLDLMKERMPQAKPRISMGVQTFDPAWLETMGRQGFGDYNTVVEVVEQARRRDIRVSLDLLHDLPGQSLDAMREDVRKAIDLRMDQICLYHLVLEPDLDTAWAEDRNLLATRVSSNEGCEHWLVLREMLISAGYVQTTLTNFELAEQVAKNDGFAYERMGFCPERYSAIGVGPGALSLVTNARLTRVWKTENYAKSDDYLEAASRKGQWPWVSRYFAFGTHDVEILWITRKIALGSISTQAFTQQFGYDIMKRYGDALGPCLELGLLEEKDTRINLTPRGMYFADSIAGLVASRRIDEIRTKRWLRDTNRVSSQCWQYSDDDRRDNSIAFEINMDPNDARFHGMG